MSARRLSPAWLAAAGLALLVTSTPGCIGLASNLMYAIRGGPKIKAEFAGLQKKRVAVVCVSSDGSGGPRSAPRRLERESAAILEQNVKQIELIHQDDVVDWRENHDWDQSDYREIGRGLNAEMVVAVDLASFRLHEGRTLYRGQADLVVTVYDMTDDGNVAFRKEIHEFTFPRDGPRPTTEISEGRFRRLFVHVLAQQVGKHFYDYHLEDDFATDALSLDL